MGLGNTGVSPSYKVPRFIAKLIFAAGLVSAGADRLSVLAVGMKTTNGSMIADASPVGPVTDMDDVDAKAGPGSELAMNAYQVLQQDSVNLYMAAVTEPSGGTAATATILIGGTWSTGGTLYFRIAGVNIAVNVNPTDIVTDVGAKLAAAFNAKSRTPITATFATATVTATCKNKGVGGKNWILYHDSTDRPAGMTITLTGSANVNGANVGVRLGASSTGTGAEDVTTLITRLATKRYARIALSHNDATNAQAWETYVNNKAGPLSLLLEQLVFGSTGTLTTAQSLAQTTLNIPRASVLWCRNSENHPGEIAGRMAALRSVEEQTEWVPDYDGRVLDSLTPQAFPDDLPTDPEQDLALNTGVTPLISVNGNVQVVRAITTYCLNGTAQDERCLDIGDIVATDQITVDLQLMYQTEFRPQNPYVGPDPAEGEEPPPEGVAYPKLWASAVQARLEDHYESKWLEERPLGNFAPKYGYNKIGKFIAGDTPLAIRRVQHRIDNVVRQTSNSA